MFYWQNVEQIRAFFYAEMSKGIPPAPRLIFGYATETIVLAFKSTYWRN